MSSEDFVLALERSYGFQTKLYISIDVVVIGYLNILACVKIGNS